MSMLGKRLNNAGLLFMGKQSRMDFLVEVVVFSYFHSLVSLDVLEFSDKAYIFCK